MRWNARVAGLSVVAAILIVPLAAQAGSLRRDDAPPLEGHLRRRALFAHQLVHGIVEILGSVAPVAHAHPARHAGVRNL